MTPEDEAEFAALVSGFTRMKDATRCVLFETGIEGFDYATWGGTAFIIAIDDRPYGVTALHVRQDFKWSGLALTDGKFGTRLAGIDGIYHGKEPIKDSIDTDLMDVAVVGFSSDVDCAFFVDEPYRITSLDINAEPGDILTIHGVPKTHLEINYDSRNIRPIFHSIELEAGEISPYDSTTRSARGHANLDSLSGFSGAPIWNVTKGALSGMAVRGGINSNGEVLVRFVEISDIRRMLDAVHVGEEQVSYFKETRR